jgi:hypothetical protein
MKKGWKYVLLAAVILLVGYNSVYTRKLSEVQKTAKAEAFDAAAYARHFLEITLPMHPEKEIDLVLLSQTLAGDPARAFSWSHAQNDGNNRYFLVKGAGKITTIDSEYVHVAVEGVKQPVLLATKYIVGTAIRDGSGLISVNEFTTTMEMNAVSEELNKLIRTKELPPFLQSAKLGDRVMFLGAMEARRDKGAPATLEITPINIQ